MDKSVFITELKKRLTGLPQEDIDGYAEYYSEMIDDRVEEGMSEEQAVAEIGSLDRIVSEILRTTPIAKLVKEKVRPKRRLRPWEIVLIAVGSPIWISLGFAAICVVFAVYIVLWALVVTLCCVNIALAASALALLAACAGVGIAGKIPECIMCAGTAFVLAGIAILMFLGVRGVVKGAVFLSKKIVQGIKSCFVRKAD